MAPAAWAAPTLYFVSIGPVPLRPGEPYFIELEATEDTVQAVATLDFRPWSPRILRTVLRPEGGLWVGEGRIPPDLQVPAEEEPQLTLLLLDAARARSETRFGASFESVSAVFDPGTGVLTVTGDDRDNELIVHRTPPGRILVNHGVVRIFGGIPTVANTARIEMIGRAGADVLVLDETHGPLPPAHFDGGPGADAMFGGSGDDTFLWQPGDGSDVIEGGAGSDALDFFGSDAAETVDLSANGERLRFFRAPGNIRMDVAGVERVTFLAMGGADHVTVNDLTGTGVTEVVVDLHNILGFPDRQSDRVTVRGTAGDDRMAVVGTDHAVVVQGLSVTVQVLGAEGASDILAIEGLGGDDVIDASSLPPGRILLEIDGGDGGNVIVQP